MCFFDRVMRMVAAMALTVSLASCDSLPDLDNVFNPKKPLPGERKPVFSDGVPGVPQGVPPELVRGYQAPATEQPPSGPVQGEAPPVQQVEKPKPKPRPTRVAVPTRPPTSITVQPTTQAPAAAPAGVSAWPAPSAAGQQQQSNPPATQWPRSDQNAPPAPSPWPAAPPPGTFSR